MKHLNLLLILILLFSSVSTFAQRKKTSDTPSGLDLIQEDQRMQRLTFAGDQGFLFSKKRPAYLNRISMNGYVRMMTTFRNITDSINYFSVAEGRNLFAGDEGYTEPLALVNISGRPSKNSSFNTDLHFQNFFPGSVNTGKLLPYFSVNFSGSMNTDFGNFRVRLGGLHWYEISELTMGSISKVDRYSIFERTPWEPFTQVNSKYENYYNLGSINKDARWGKREFNGLILESDNLPLSLYGKFLYGKTGQNGGYLSNIPNNAYGGSLGKKFNRDEFVAYNTFNKVTFSDSVQGEPVGYNIHTVNWNKIFPHVIVRGEVGVGNYHSPTYEKAWSEGINLKVIIPEKLSVPVEILAFRVGKNFINQSSAVANTSIEEANGDYIDLGNNTDGQVISNPFSSPLIDLEDVTNNRQGAGIRVKKEVKKLKFMAGLGISKELESKYNQLSYGHRINSLAMNRVITGWQWWSGNTFGAYGRTHGYFRGVYEVVNITDTNLVDKHFSVLDFQAKYKTKIRRKPLFAFYNLSLKSVQDFMSPIPAMNDQAFLRVGYHEFDLYYQLSPKVMLTTYFGYETIKGNDRTDLDIKSGLDTTKFSVDDRNNYELLLATGKPRNQRSIGVGVGFDIVIAKNTALYIRQRWFNFRDENFAYDYFKGYQLTAELKMFF